jgi:hypothetical protein
LYAKIKIISREINFSLKYSSYIFSVKENNKCVDSLMAKQWLNSLHVGSNPIQHIITLIGILARYYNDLIHVIKWLSH